MKMSPESTTPSQSQPIGRHQEQEKDAPNSDLLTALSIDEAWSVVVVDNNKPVEKSVVHEERVVINYLTYDEFLQVADQFLNTSPCLYFKWNKTLKKNKIKELVQRREKVPGGAWVSVLCTKEQAIQVPTWLEKHIVVNNKVDVQSPNQIFQLYKQRVQNAVNDEVNKDQHSSLTVRVDVTVEIPSEKDQSTAQNVARMLQDAICDHTSYQRQMLSQVYGLFNIRVIRYCIQNQSVVQLEILPNWNEKFKHFLYDAEDELTDLLIKELPKNYSKSFDGKLNVTVHDRLEVLKKLEMKMKTSSATSQLSTDGGCYSKRSQSKLETDGPCNTAYIHQSINPVNTESGKTLDSTSSDTCKVNDVIEMLDDSRCTPAKMTKLLKSHPNEMKKIRDKRGFNILHLMVDKSRVDLFSCVLFANLWGILRLQQVEPPESGGESSNVVGFTPRRLAESRSTKGERYKVLIAYEKWEQKFEDMSEFCRLCLGNNLSLIKEYLKLNPSVINESDSNGNTALLVASAAGHLDVLQLLLQKGADLHAVNECKSGFIHLLMKYGHLELLKTALQSQTEQEACADDTSSIPAIGYAAMNGCTDSIDLWREHGLPLDARVMTYASKYSQDRLVEHLLEERDQNSLDVNGGADEDGRNSLCHAVINNDKSMMQILLSHGADICYKQKDNKNIFHLAAQNNAQDVLPIMIEKAKGLGMLQKLVTNKDSFVGKDLMQIVRGKDKQRRAWHYVEVRRHLVNAFQSKMATGQIDVAQFGKIHCCGFGMAPDDESMQKVTKLISGRLREGVPDMTPLHIAVLKGNLEVAITLLDCGADPNAADHFDLSPAHYAAMIGNITILKRLERHGARLDFRNKDGYSILDIAQDNGHHAIDNFLQAQQTITQAAKFTDVLGDITQKISDIRLQKERQQGHNVRQYLISVLRDLTIDINVSLLGLASGPVLEESQTVQSVS